MPYMPLLGNCGQLWGASAGRTHELAIQPLLVNQGGPCAEQPSVQPAVTVTLRNPAQFIALFPPLSRRLSDHSGRVARHGRLTRFEHAA